MTKRLETMDAETLMEMPMEPLRFFVRGLIPQGLHILAGAPKIGKSWLALWICLQAAKGEPVWGFETQKCEVLYLCLEDSFARIQSRLFELTEEAPPSLHFAVMSDAIGNGLEIQIETFVKEHPGTGLIVIDTLQKVRKTVSSNVNPYAADYDDISALKGLADRHSFERREFTLRYDGNDGMTGENAPADLPSLPSQPSGEAGSPYAAPVSPRVQL